MKIKQIIETIQFASPQNPSSDNYSEFVLNKKMNPGITSLEEIFSWFTTSEIISIAKDLHFKLAKKGTQDPDLNDIIRLLSSQRGRKFPTDSLTSKVISKVKQYQYQIPSDKLLSAIKLINSEGTHDAAIEKVLQNRK